VVLHDFSKILVSLFPVIYNFKLWCRIVYRISPELINKLDVSEGHGYVKKAYIFY